MCFLKFNGDILLSFFDKFIVRWNFFFLWRCFLIYLVIFESFCVILEFEGLKMIMKFVLKLLIMVLFFGFFVMYMISGFLNNVIKFFKLMLEFILKVCFLGWKRWGIWRIGLNILLFDRIVILFELKLIYFGWILLLKKRLFLR